MTKQIDAPGLKNAHINYIKDYNASKVLERIINDLGKYKTAIEWALMKYHSEKMENINKIIRDLWANIYRLVLNFSLQAFAWN